MAPKIVTAVVIEIVLPAEHQNVAGVTGYRAKLVAAATELGWGLPHTTDTKTRLAGGVPINIALQREKLPVGVGLHWEVDSDEATIHQVVATIRDQFDVEYATVDGVLIPAPAEAYALAASPTD